MDKETEEKFEALEKRIKSIQGLFMFIKLGTKYMLAVIGLVRAIIMVTIFIRLIYTKHHK